MKNIKSFKHQIITCICLFIVYSIIFFITRSYITSNDLLNGTVQKVGIFILIAVAIVINVLMYKFSTISKIFTIYTSIILSFLMSIYVDEYRKISDYVIIVAFIAVYILLLKFASKKLEKIDEKINIYVIFIVYIFLNALALIFETVIFDVPVTILIINKFYFTLKKDEFLKKENCEVIISLITFASIFTLFYSILFYLDYDSIKKINNSEF